MLSKDTILFHKDYLINIFNGELSMEEAIFLISKYQGKGFTIHFPNTIKEKLAQQGYLTIDNMLSLKAKRYVESIIDSEPTETDDIKLEEDFNTFWDVFPSTDKVHHFPGSRSLKDNKQRCKQVFAEIISEGHTLDEILSGLTKQIEELKMNSINENRLTYMKNSLRWLRDKDFLLWKDRKDNSPKLDIDVF